jgi:hypothetical protein
MESVLLKLKILLPFEFANRLIDTFAHLHINKLAHCLISTLTL